MPSPAPEDHTPVVNLLQGSKHSADHLIENTSQESANRTNKRLRISQACQQCRKRKERCNGAQPQCGSCLLGDRLCRYDPRPRKRGLQTGYVRAMEILLGLIFHACDGYEANIMALLQRKRKVVQLTASAPAITQFADIWKNSQVMKELERVLGTDELGEDQELSARELHDKLELAFTKNLVFEDIAIVAPENNEDLIVPVSPLQTATTVASTYSEPSIAQLSTPRDVSLPMLHGSLLPENIVRVTSIPSDWSRLLDIYFANIHSWFPVASKHDAFRQAFSLQNSTAEEEEEEGGLVSNAERASLFAMLALAAYQDGTLKRKRGKECGVAFGLSQRLQNTSNLMLAHAHDTSVYQLSHVQALLALTILQIQVGNISKAWVTIGQAVYIAAILDIIPLAAGIEVPKENCKRLFFGLYVLETMIAFRLGRRSYLLKSDIKAMGPLSVDSIEEWEPWRPAESYSTEMGQQSRSPGHILSSFNHFVRLVGLLPDLAKPEPSTGDVFREFQTLQVDLSPSQRKTLSSLRQNEVEVSPQSSNLSLASVSIQNVIRSHASNTANASAQLPVSPQHSAVQHHIETTKLWDCPLLSLYSFILANYGTSSDVSDNPQNAQNNSLQDLGPAGLTNPEQISNQSQWESFLNAVPSSENSLNAISMLFFTRISSK
jgi:hypothetical protein